MITTTPVIARHSILNPDGTLVKGAKPKVGDQLLLDMLRWMLMSRIYDERAIALQRQGLYGVFSPTLGQEATVVGSAMALDPARDWIVPQYRELMAVVRHGYPLERLAAIGMGRITEATRIPDGVNVLPTQVALAAQLPHATGLAWGLKLQKKDSVVATYIGDGGSSEGDFHEALNLAGVLRAPVVFFLQNNQWAISTPRRVQSATPSFALRAAGYGFPGAETAGNDVMAVYYVSVQAVERARRGEGPTLVEAVTYRMGFHNTTDNPSLYRDPDEYEEARQRDPIDRVRAYLKTLGLWDQEREQALSESLAQEVDLALQTAAASPAPRPENLFDNIYERLPERVARQRAEVAGRQGR